MSIESLIAHGSDTTFRLEPNRRLPESIEYQLGSLTFTKRPLDDPPKYDLSSLRSPGSLLANAFRSPIGMDYRSDAL